MLVQLRTGHILISIYCTLQMCCTCHNILTHRIVASTDATMSPCTHFCHWHALCSSLATLGLPLGFDVPPHAAQQSQALPWHPADITHPDDVLPTLDWVFQ